MSMRLLAPLLAISLLASCGHKTEPGRAAEHAKPVHVETVAAPNRTVPKTVLLAGSLRAFQESDLAANATGRVTRTMVERGSFVAQGAALLQLDTRYSTLAATEAKANMESARNQKVFADAECQRVQALHDKGAISQQEYDRAATNCRNSAENASAAEARAQQAVQVVGDGTVRAPFAGLIAERFVSAGEYVNPASHVAHLVDIDPLRLELSIAATDMGAVKVGQQVEFEVSAFPDRHFTGTVRYIGPSVRSSTRDLVFEALVPNHDRLLRPGLFATARLTVGQQQLPAVPKSALRKDGDTQRLFVVSDRTVEERVVQGGSQIGDEVVILKGLGKGEQVVLHPSVQVVDGVAVE